MVRSAHDVRNSAVDGVMGSTARRGGDGVRYCDGRSPTGGKKDAALIISACPEDVWSRERYGKRSTVRGDALAVGGCKAGTLDHAD